MTKAPCRRSSHRPPIFPCSRSPPRPTLGQTGLPEDPQESLAEQSNAPPKTPPSPPSSSLATSVQLNLPCHHRSSSLRIYGNIHGTRYIYIHREKINQC